MLVDEEVQIRRCRPSSTACEKKSKMETRKVWLPSPSYINFVVGDSRFSSISIQFSYSETSDLLASGIKSRKSVCFWVGMPRQSSWTTSCTASSLTKKKVQLPFPCWSIFRIVVFGDFRLVCIRNKIQEKVSACGWGCQGRALGLLHEKGR